MRGRQTVNALKKRFRRCRIFKGNIIIQRIFVQFLFKTGEFEDALDFGSINEMAVNRCVMQRFNAEKIAR